MKHVWQALIHVIEKELVEEQKKETLRNPLEPHPTEHRLHTFRPQYDLRTWNINNRGIPISVQFCGAFFLLLLHDWSYYNFTATRAKLDGHAKRWSDAAAVCREAIGAIPFMEPTFRDALPKIAQHLDKFSDLIKNEGNPRILPHGGKDDQTRSSVRSLAQATKALFGNYCDSTLATVATVAFELENPLDKGMIQKWCEGLEPYRYKL